MGNYTFDGKILKNRTGQKMGEIDRTFIRAWNSAKLGEIDRKIDDLIKFRDDLRQYHQDLSGRSVSGTGHERGTQGDASCQCLGEKV